MNQKYARGNSTATNYFVAICFKKGKPIFLSIFFKTANRVNNVDIYLQTLFTVIHIPPTGLGTSPGCGDHHPHSVMKGLSINRRRRSHLLFVQFRLNPESLFTRFSTVLPKVSLSNIQSGLVCLPLVSCYPAQFRLKTER